SEGEACNTCNSCVSFDAGTSLNIHELDAASNNSVDDIRTLVEQVRFAPQAGKYKVYIVDEVHMLSNQAFNAFLKTLEEPPPFAIFILATTEKHKILPTILSRCQIFDFKRITNNDTVEHLQEICNKESIHADKAALHIISQKSEGCLRDALSILDKIVSFTNGELNYSSTLEHLNILDEDYYFNFLEYMQQQNMTAAMLLFDEINRKGFEGDIIIEGFAEFVRNLLVSKDAKAAILLEVADDFKQKYMQKAQQVTTGWLIAALNLLGEAEINYKQARNKRLLVELTIIKLSYLQQAIELVNNDGVVSKKKLIDSVKPVAFRALPFVGIKEVRQMEEPSVQKNIAKPNVEAKLTIETSAPEIKKQTLPSLTQSIQPQSENAQPKTIIGSLNAIRQKLTEQNKVAGLDQKILTHDALKDCWELFIAQLIERNNPAAVTNFKNAAIAIIDANTIEITTKGDIHRAFIENERATLILHFQNYFNNRLLVYRIVVIEADSEIANTNVPLSRKQQYQKIIEEYPLVKELKERLKLELD
ncbi:MAG: DNA polymerase III subunit gamma/tau, partial [Ferruginibacter sp.]